MSIYHAIEKQHPAYLPIYLPEFSFGARGIALDYVLNFKPLNA